MVRTVALLLLTLSAVSPSPHRVATGDEWFVAPDGAGAGTRDAPFRRIDDALRVAQPGDTITVGEGVYAESLSTARDGEAGQPIRVRAEGPRGSVVVTAPGRVLRVNHPHFIVEGLVFDGQYGPADTVSVSTRADFLVLRNIEVRRSSRDLIDMGSPRGVLIEGSLVHHALNAAGGRTDAHGIAAAAVRGLTIRDTEIHTFSGDGIQIDSARLAPGWSDVTVERCHIWLAPLPAAANGFAAGVVPGENAIDTKSSPGHERATLTVRDTIASGFRDGLIANMSAFNLKEHVEVTLDGVTVSDSEIAFRLRGPTAGARGGAWVTIMNAVIHDTETAFRYENDIERLRIWNTTIGRGVGRVFRAASSASRGLEVRNFLVLGSLPSEAAHPSNLGVETEAFVNAARHDYRLAPGARGVDAGITIGDVTTDRIGTPRPQGRGPDVGAYERVP
jgi:hypothetical protein